MIVTPIFKQAEKSDKVYFFNLYCSAMKGHVEDIWGWDLNWQKNNFETSWNASSNYKIVHHNINIGFIQFLENDSDIYIEMFILESGQRSSGLGQIVLHKLEQIYPNKSFSLRVFRNNNRALSFYKNNGYRITSKEECFYVLQRKAA